MSYSGEPTKKEEQLAPTIKFFGTLAYLACMSFIFIFFCKKSVAIIRINSNKGGTHVQDVGVDKQGRTNSGNI